MTNEFCPRMTFWKQIVTYGNVLFFLGNETTYTNSNTHIYVSKDNGDTFSEPIWTGNIPLGCYNTNTLYIGNSQDMSTDRVWKTTVSKQF